MRRIEIRVEPVEAFFERGRKAAALANRGKRIPPSRVVAFEAVEDLLRVLTGKRILLLKSITQTPGSIAELARRLKRDRSSVARDVQMLEHYGIVKVSEKRLPGHGQQKWVRPMAREIELTAHF